VYIERALLLTSVWFIDHQTLSVKFKCALQVMVFACGATLSAEMQKKVTTVTVVSRI